MKADAVLAAVVRDPVLEPRKQHWIEKLMLHRIAHATRTAVAADRRRGERARQRRLVDA